MGRKRCGKKGYPSWAAAVAALWSLPPGRAECRPYRCGRHVRVVWHLTSNVRLGRRKRW